MIYIVGIIGFIGGFACGLMILHFMLRHKSRADLLNDKNLKWKFGILCWLVAALGAYSFITMYKLYFG